jgi:hypothetical protein
MEVIHCFLFFILELCVLSEASAVPLRYLVEPSFDSKMANISLLKERRSEFLTECSSMCSGLCTCFGFNSQFQKCRIYRSCDLLDMAIDETGWRNFHPEGIKPGMLDHNF